jgi:glucokinase
MILAGDVGGTETRLGLFEPRRPRPQPLVTRSFNTRDYTELGEMVAALMSEAASSTRAIQAACFGVAGPVVHDTVELTNVGWQVDARRLGERSGIGSVYLLNDLLAMAYGATVLHESELYPLQAGDPGRGGNRALIAAGTGLGEALLHDVDGRLVPSPSEGGHADFAARNEREIRLLRDLLARYGRAVVEHVVSGRGLVNIHRVMHRGDCPIVDSVSDSDAPAAISAAALAGRCQDCVETLDLFIEAYGAEAGNLVLRTMATGGLLVGGGIAPKILPALGDGRFLRAFRNKAPYEALLDAVPVKVILNTETALLGAAVYAATRTHQERRAKG